MIGPGPPRSFRWTLLDSASFDADGDGRLDHPNRLGRRLSAETRRAAFYGSGA